MVKPGGRHLIADFWGVHSSKLTNCEQVDANFRQAAQTAGATVLSSHFHEFGEGCGITGVLILSESHISIHTWPESNYCAVDIFMCGDCNPQIALNVIETHFNSQYSKTQLIQRG